MAAYAETIREQDEVVRYVSLGVRYVSLGGAFDVSERGQDRTPPQGSEVWAGARLDHPKGAR
jgi:hypothetical protein